MYVQVYIATLCGKQRFSGLYDTKLNLTKHYTEFCMSARALTPYSALPHGITSSFMHYTLYIIHNLAISMTYMYVILYIHICVCVRMHACMYI